MVWKLVCNFLYIFWPQPVNAANYFPQGTRIKFRRVMYDQGGLRWDESPDQSYGHGATLRIFFRCPFRANIEDTWPLLKFLTIHSCENHRETSGNQWKSWKDHWKSYQNSRNIQNNKAPPSGAPPWVFVVSMFAWILVWFSMIFQDFHWFPDVFLWFSHEWSKL